MTKKPLGFFILFLIIFLTPFNAIGKEELLIGLIPEENIFKQMDRYKPLAEYLSSRLGIKVRLTILSRYGDIIDKFITRDMDGAFFGGLTGVLAMEKLGVQPIAMPVMLDGTTFTKSYIFVRSNSSIKNIRGMRGKRMVFVDKAAASYLFATAFFRENGITNIDRYLKEYYFTGSNDSAIYSVLDNRSDIGAAESRAYKRMAEKHPSIKNELNIIAESKEFPDIILCLKKDLPVEIKTKIKAILLNMDKDTEGKDVLKKLEASKFIVADKKDFLLFYDLANKAGVDIRSYKY